MKIEQLEIYGFGRHSDVIIELTEGITVFYGENEAGKTTIHQFILHILFGFPPKSHAILRYEPKNGAAYGGKIRLSDSRYGIVEVERIRGKSAGDVTVRFADGTVGGQERLAELLRQYNRTAFESIFSFSLFQLQGLEQMDADELSRTLLSSGTTGIDVLMQLEKKMEKEKGELFKKSGKNPEMNLKIRELRELEVTLKTERAKIDEYEPSILRLQEVEQVLSAKRKGLQELVKEVDRLRSAQLRIPIIENKKKLSLQLDRLGATSFPPNGIREQELLESKKHEAEAKISRSMYQLESLEVQVEQAIQSERLEEIEGLLAKESDWQVFHQQNSNLHAEIGRLRGERKRLLGRLGATNSETVERIVKADSSLMMEQKLHELTAELQQVSKKSYSYKVEWQRTKGVEQRTNEQLARIIEEAPTAEEQAQAAKWPDVRARLSEAKAYISISKEEPQTSSKQMNVLLLAIAVIIAIYGVLQQQWILAVLGVIIAVISSRSFMKKQPAQTQADEQLKEMKALLDAYEGKEARFEELCKRTDEYNRTNEQLSLTVEKYAKDLEVLQVDWAQTNIEEAERREQLQTVLNALGLSSSAGLEVIPELFRMIRDLQEAEHLLEARVQEQQIIKDKIVQHETLAASVLQREVSQTNLYTLIRQEARALQESAYSAEAEALQAKELKQTLEETALELKAYREQEKKLFELASAKDKESYYEAHDRLQEAQTIRLKLDSLNEQLEGLQTVVGVIEEASQIQQRSTELEGERLENEQLIEELTNERASLVHKTDALLSDDAHLRTQQLFENKKAEFNALAFEWSTRQVTAEAIRQTMSELKEKKLPAVLQLANTFFHQLTGDVYTTLDIKTDGLFQATRNDDQTFEIAELSQATKEQAYVSLRLALADELTTEAPFPLVMDDPFVHFDASRLIHMTNLLSSLSSNHQIIVFTCHETLAANWPDATMIKVSEIGKRQEAIIYEKINRS